MDPVTVTEIAVNWTGWIQVGLTAATLLLGLGAARQKLLTMERDIKAIRTDLEHDIEQQGQQLGERIERVRETAGKAHSRIDRHLEAAHGNVRRQVPGAT